MKTRLLVLLMLICILTFASVDVGEYPIIFIHGIDSVAIPDAGVYNEESYRKGCLFAWHPMKLEKGELVEVDSTALLKIIGYKGYIKGSPFDCTKESEPIDVIPNVVYNFSYYNPDGSQGVIGFGEQVNGQPNFVPENADYEDDYRASFLNGQWAKNVAEFIRKVYNNTGKQVYIVAHSMGGPVVRSALTYYGAGECVKKVITIGSPNKPFVQNMFIEKFAIYGKFQEFQKKGELLELGVDAVTLTSENTLFKSILDPDRERDQILNILNDEDYLKFNDDSTKFATIIGMRKAPATFLLDYNDGYIPCEQQWLTYADKVPYVFASHGNSSYFLGDRYKFLQEYSERNCEFLLSYIKYWMIDALNIIFTGDEDRLYGSFGFVYDDLTPQSASLRLIVSGKTHSGENLENYNGIMCASISTITQDVILLEDIGRAKGFDFTVLDLNNRVPGELRGSPVYQINSDDYNNPDFKNVEHFISEIWLYDMNGIISPDYSPLPPNFYDLNTRYAVKPFINITSDASNNQLNAFTSGNINLSTNEVAIGTQLSYRFGSLPYNLIGKVNYQENTFTWTVPPQTAYKTTEPDSKYWPKVEFRAVYYLDDYGAKVIGTRILPINTPDWNPDNLELIISDEDSIRLKWEIEYEAESIKLYRDGICIATLAGNVTAYTDMSFALGVYNHYEVKAKYGELTSINDNETNKLDVYGIAANPPKPYPLANFNENKTSFNIKWIDNSYFEAGYSLIIEPDGGTPVNYRVLATGDTISYQASIPIGYTSGTISILTKGPKDGFLDNFLDYCYAVNDGLPFYSVQPFAISQSKGNLSFSNGNYLIASSREYSTYDTVFSIEEYDGLRKNIIFSEFCNGERDVVTSSDQKVVMYTDNNSTEFLKVMYKDDLGTWHSTTVSGVFDFAPGNAIVKLHSLIEKNGNYYLLISREYLSSSVKGVPCTNLLNIVKLSRTSDLFSIVASTTILSDNLLIRTYHEGTLKVLSDGRIGMTCNSHIYPYESDDFTGLIVATIDDELVNIKRIIDPVPNSYSATSDFDILNGKAKVLIRRATSSQNIVELRTYKYTSVWGIESTEPIDSKQITYEYLGNPSVIYSNNGLFLSWVYNNKSTYQAIVNYNTVNSSGLLSAKKTALSLNNNITDYAIQNQDGLIKIIAQYYDEDITGGTYMLSEISPSYNEIALNLSNTFYGYSDETINLTAKDIFTGEVIANAAVTLTNNRDFSFIGITDANGSISIPYYTESDNDMVITVDKEYYQKKILKALVTINNMNVSLPSDMPVLTTKALNFKVTVSSGVSYPDATQIPLSGATITLQSTDITFTGVTNLLGSVSCIKKTAYTTPISVTITKDRYRTYEAEIYPYMWSTTNEALGENNQTHMVRKPATSYLSIIYSDGDSIVYGSSSDFGKIWHLVKIGAGTMPTLARRSGGLTALWKNGQMLEYATMSSPWSPVDTVISPAYSVSEPNLFKHPDPANDSLFACVIESRQVQTCGDYILATWYDVLVESMTSEVIVPYTGDIQDESVIPNKQPIVCKYLAIGNYYNLISFISSNNQLIAKLQNPMYSYYKVPFIVSNDNQIVSNSSFDVYGNTTTFTWSADNLSSSEIWHRKLVDGNFSDAERIDNLNGFNSNPKVKDNFIYGYVNDAKRIVTTSDISNENAFLVIEEAEDSLFNFDYVVKKTNIDADAFFVLSEGSNGNYRIKTMRVNYSGIAQPRIISDPTDTIVENISSSPIYDYVSGRPFVERMTYDAIALDTVLNYDVRLVVSQTNPVRPQVLMFDTTVIDVIYGTPNTVDTLQYTVPKELYTDGEFMITLDRLRGNPNRTAQIAIYEYETDSAEGTIAGDGKLKKLIFKPQMPNQQFEYYLASGLEFGNGLIKFSLAEQGDVILNMYDVSGRCVANLATGVFNQGLHHISMPSNLSSGVYFVKMETGDQTFIEKMVRIK